MHDIPYPLACWYYYSCNVEKTDECLTDMCYQCPTFARYYRTDLFNSVIKGISKGLEGRVEQEIYTQVMASLIGKLRKLGTSKS